MVTTTAGFELAFSLWARMKGLLDPAVCAKGEILALIPCKSIHSLGMREAIDVAFIDRRGRVLRAEQGLPPRRFLACKGAACVLERRSRADEPWLKRGQAVGLAAWPGKEA
ncbi:MAG: DUF192 domain-containing protein [Coriobacteriales bacterium]|jgi:hypothetical protein|nr:DUF192 domain-containing protein [Coriobacteriales bacterium]